MTMAVLGDKGQVTIPRAVRQRLRLRGGDPLLVDVAADGSIVLRPAGVYPVEVYTDERLAEFARENQATPAERRRIRRAARGG